MESKMEHKDILQKVKCSCRNAVGLEESMKQRRIGRVERAGGAWRGCTGFCCWAADVLFQLTWKRECEGWAGGKVRKRFYGRRWSPPADSDGDAPSGLSEVIWFYVRQEVQNQHRKPKQEGSEWHMWKSLTGTCLSQGLDCSSASSPVITSFAGQSL